MSESFQFLPTRETLHSVSAAPQPQEPKPGERKFELWFRLSGPEENALRWMVFEEGNGEKEQGWFRTKAEAEAYMADPEAHQGEEDA
jgi:hypothetical protein